MNSDWRKLTPIQREAITALSRGLRIPRSLVFSNVPWYLRLYDMRYRP